MNVLESILGDDASDGGYDEQDNTDGDHEVAFTQQPSFITEPVNGAEAICDGKFYVKKVNDTDPAAESDDSRRSSSDNVSTNRLEAEKRYFALNVLGSDELATKESFRDESSFTTKKEIKEKIFNALKLSDVTVLFASQALQCFLGYAEVQNDKISSADARVSVLDDAIPIRLGKLCRLPFQETSKIINVFNNEQMVSQFESGQEIDAAAADDVLCFINNSGTEVESVGSLQKLLNNVSVGKVDEESDTAVQVDTELKEDILLMSGSSEISSSGMKNSRIREEEAGGKRPRTDSIVSSSSTQGSTKGMQAKTRSVSSNLPKPPRPKNMFDITAMNYEQYVDRHYAIKYEQWFQESNSMMSAAPGPGPGMGSGMVPGPGGMPIPMAMAMAMAGGGFYGGPGVYPMGGQMMMGGGMMGMPPNGPNPMLMHGEGGMFQGMGMHEAGLPNHLFNDRSRGGRGGGGGGNGRVARF